MNIDRLDELIEALKPLANDHINVPPLTAAEIVKARKIAELQDEIIELIKTYEMIKAWGRLGKFVLWGVVTLSAVLLARDNIIAWINK